ncbi:hypothetical protein GCM10009609_31150 [Pseudonocardia aurantiaca]|uniref:Uncharacterized protein n=1 Tax=Pseudonocardia aurantiaca TaxID=75290 RepID=A0ABW4FV57_9PSEU
MRIRTLAAAALAAAGLSVTLTGAASATSIDDPPPGDAFVITCEGGRSEVRPITEEERAKFEEMRDRAIEEGVVKEGPGEHHVRVDGEPGGPKDGPFVVFKGPPPGDSKELPRGEFKKLPPGAEPVPGERVRGVFIVRGEGVPGDKAAGACELPDLPPPPAP